MKKVQFLESFFLSKISILWVIFSKNDQFNWVIHFVKKILEVILKNGLIFESCCKEGFNLYESCFLKGFNSVSHVEKRFNSENHVQKGSIIFEWYCWKFHLPIHKSFKSWSQIIFKKVQFFVSWKKKVQFFRVQKCSILWLMWEKTILWVISINKKSSILWVVLDKKGLLES